MILGGGAIEPVGQVLGVPQVAAVDAGDDESGIFQGGGQVPGEVAGANDD
jgi:hypothetical protein